MEQDLASTYVLYLLNTMLGYVLQFEDGHQGLESDKGQTEVQQGFNIRAEFEQSIRQKLRREVGEVEVNTRNVGDAIIRLGCIEGDTEFIYRQFR